MKVFTCESESVLAQYIPFSTPKVKMYEHVDAPCVIVECIASRLERLIKKVCTSLLELETVGIVLCYCSYE